MTGEVFALDTVPTGAWLHKVTAQPVAYQGRAALRVELAPATVAAQDYVDSNTFVVVAVDFCDGEIEVDLLGKRQETAPPEARGSSAWRSGSRRTARHSRGSICVRRMVAPRTQYAGS